MPYFVQKHGNQWMWMCLAIPLLLQTPAAVTPVHADTSPIDSFDFATTPVANANWQPSVGTPDLAVVADGDRRVVVVSAPFATTGSLRRVVIDRTIQLDLTAFAAFQLDVYTDATDSQEQVSLYFGSGAGWYSNGTRLRGAGWHKLTFQRDQFTTEDAPGSWQQIDRIRIAIWRNSDRDTTFRLRNLSAQFHSMAIIVPDDDHPESADARRYAAPFRTMLNELGIDSDLLTESTVAQGGLGQRSFAILPYSPNLSSVATAELVRFIDRGGRVFACYVLPSPLQTALGIDLGRYRRDDGQQTFHEVRLTAADFPGLPMGFQQDSWNIHSPKPVAHDARIVGRWFDATGRATGDAALIVSDHGAFFGHILLPGDHAEKRTMIAAVVGALVPRFRDDMADTAIDRAERIGHCHGSQELAAAIDPQRSFTIGPLLDRADQLLTDARRQRLINQPLNAIRLAEQARELRIDAYVKGQPSRSREGRACWEHSGTGPYPGNWDKTARLLADSGFNMIIPNMASAGMAHYASDVLPRSGAFLKYGDQIEQCVAAARRHGLQVHVWKMNFNLAGAPQSFINTLEREGRLQVTSSGTTMPWLNPAHPKNRRLEIDSLLEVARRYDVDGIHLDYIRYPDSSCCYSPFSREQFESDRGKPVAKWPTDCTTGELADEYRAWRRDQITKLVQQLRTEVAQLDRSVTISAAVFAGYPQCRDSVGQDWVEWVNRGCLDFICPMSYTDDDEEFATWVSNHVERLQRRIPIYAGIGATASTSTLAPDRVIGQIRIARRLGAAGVTIFNLTPSVIEESVPAFGSSAGQQSATPPHDTTRGSQ